MLQIQLLIGKTLFTEYIHFFTLKFVLENSIFHVSPNVNRFSKKKLFARIGHLKKIYLKNEDFGVARMREGGECGLD